MPSRLTRRLVAAGLTVSFAFAAAAPATANGRRIDIDTDPANVSDQTLAKQALADAQALFSPVSGSVRARRAAAKTGAPRDATLVLRNLRVRAADLPTATQRATAARILGRPTTSDDPTGGGEPKYDASSPVGRVCGTHVCVHWVEDGSSDAVDDDGNVGTVPTQATRTLSVLEHVYAVEVTNMGYRPPVSDADSANSGATGSTANNAKTDIYLADVGVDDLYGYCTTDDPDAINFTQGDRQVSSYCVLDNDYDAAQFPYNTPLENLQVTAAHEFFHAIQNAYDWLEDPWLVEGTATWMEDEVYDSVNDNRQYLGASPLTVPFYPLDYGTDSTAGNLDILKYGAWIWWRFLSERAGSGAADDPTIVRQVWEAAVTRYSTSALNAVLAQRGSTFADWFAAFGTWTSNPASYFSEGSAYPKPQPDDSFTLSSSHKTTGSLSTSIDHMARSFVSVKPASGLSSTVKLKLAVNLADTSHGSVAQAVIHKKSGGLSIKRIPLSSTGYANVTYGFSPSQVSYIKLDFANASTRFTCQQDTGDVYESCHGLPTYDAQEARFNATLTH